MISNVNLQVFALFMLLLILANNHKTLASSIYRRNDYLHNSLSYGNDQPRFEMERENLSRESMENEIPVSDFWSLIFRPNHIPAISAVNLRRGITTPIPFKKRKIPLELQKALYAHGIVGRRR